MTNGIKQGVIVSQILFKIYINNLGILLNIFKIGGKIHGQLINVYYDDDIRLICISYDGMQHLLEMCTTYAAERPSILRTSVIYIYIYIIIPALYVNIPAMYRTQSSYVSNTIRPCI